MTTIILHLPLKQTKPRNSMTTPYQRAVGLLQSRSQQRRQSQDPTYTKSNLPNVWFMRSWLAELGYEDLSNLPIIHITGTKGKGSVAAFTDSLLRAHYHRRAERIKIGLYTSPYIREERDRIRINFEPISEELFATNCLEIWARLSRGRSDDDPLPGYLQLLTLLSVRVFKEQGVDVAIYEVHAGGRNDATNIWDNLFAAAFTLIGLDHKRLLGNSLESVSEHKSEIMKRNRPAFSVKQDPRVAKVLESKARQLGSPLQQVDIDPNLPDIPQLRLEAQKSNASLAIQLAKAFLKDRGEELTMEDIAAGLAGCAWPGRFHVIRQNSAHWFLDSAHNSLSLPVALEWYKAEIRTRPLAPQILVFGHESDRNTSDLIGVVVQSCLDHGLHFDEVILTPYMRSGIKTHVSSIDDHVRFWQSLQPSLGIRRASSVEETMTEIQRAYGGKEHLILVTGSTYLVGETLKYLEDGKVEE